MLFPLAQNVSLEQRLQCAHVHGEQASCVDLGVHVVFVQVDQGRLVGTVSSVSQTPLTYRLPGRLQLA